MLGTHKPVVRNPRERRVYFRVQASGALLSGGTLGAFAEEITHAMKLIPRSIVARCITVGAIIGLLALTPSLIHFAYRMTTPPATKQTQTERYNYLANVEASGKSFSEERRLSIQDERLKSFYWFHSRGWSIDEGHEDESWLQPWRELIRYWKGEPGRIGSR